MSCSSVVCCRATDLRECWFVAGALEEHELELSDIQQQYEDQLADLKERREDKQTRVEAAA